jgi:hypothetical protein
MHVRLGRRSPRATTAPEGEDHIKVQASLDCKRNIMPPLVLLGGHHEQCRCATASYLQAVPAPLP